MRSSCIKIYYDSKNYTPTANSWIGSPSINLFITDDKSKIYLLLQNFSWNGNFGLYTAISMTLRLLFVHLLLGRISFSRPVTFPFNNVPNVNSASMKNQRTGLFLEIKHRFTFLVKGISTAIISTLVRVYLFIMFSPELKVVAILTLVVALLNNF